GPSFVIESEPLAEEEGEAESSEAGSVENGNGAEAQSAEPRSWRGRRRRRGRRGDSRAERGLPESRYARPADTPAARPTERQERPGRPTYGPPPGYQPIILPGESISKYQRYQ